jgi:hypothetical protein
MVTMYGVRRGQNRAVSGRRAAGAEAVLGFPGRQRGRAGAAKKHRVNQTYQVIINILVIHLTQVAPRGSGQTPRWV